MTSYPDAAVVAAPVSRPGTLFAAIGVAVVSAVAGILEGVLFFAGGRELALDLAAKAIATITGGTPESVKADGGALLAASVDEVQATLQARAVVAIVFGVLMLVVTLLMLGGSTWSRVLVTIAGLLNAGVALRIATDIEGSTGAIRGSAWAAVATGVLVVVLAWLPANNRYAKARKAR